MSKVLKWVKAAFDMDINKEYLPYPVMNILNKKDKTIFKIFRSGGISVPAFYTLINKDSKSVTIAGEGLEEILNKFIQDVHKQIAE